LQLAAQAVDPDGYVDIDRPSVRRIAAVASAVGRRARLGLHVSPEAERLQRRWKSLTPRERQVLAFLSGGHDNLKLAAWLGISERGIKAHVSSLFTKLGVTNRTALALLAYRAGLRCPVEDQSRAALSFRTVDGVDRTR
jgi:DNA-binding NarL/FixJ family response regulator